MDYIPVENTALVQLIQVLDQQRIENTLYFFRADGWDIEGLTDLGAAAAAWWVANIAPNVSQELSLVQVISTDLTTQTSPSVTVNVSPAEPGTRVQASEPNNVAICISFRTALRGRSFRGRNYISGLGVSDVTGNTFDQNLLDAIVEGYQSLVDTPLLGDTSWSVVSRFTNNEPREAGEAVPILTALSIDNVIDSQRRRLPGRGQ